MAVELITGMAGTAHIHSGDIAKFNAAVCGPGNYLMTGMGDRELAASMATANSLRVQSGNIVAQGRHIIIDGSGLAWTVQNGTQGQRRNDLAVLRYTRSASTGIETIAPVTIKGAATSGTPADPAHIAGDALNGTATTFDIPVYRVPLNGITPGIPQLMLERFTPAKEAWDSVAHAPVAVGTLASGWTGGVEVTRYGNLVVCGIDMTYRDETALPKNYDYATIPAGYRPARDASIPALWAAVDGHPAYVTVTPAGGVQADSLGRSARRLIAVGFWRAA